MRELQYGRIGRFLRERVTRAQDFVTELVE